MFSASLAPCICSLSRRCKSAVTPGTTPDVTQSIKLFLVLSWRPQCRGASSISKPIANEGIDTVVGGAEAAQLDALAVDNFLGITVAPLDGHFAVGVGVDEHVEGTVAAELGQECDRGCDLPENGGDLGLDFCFRLLGRCIGGCGSGGRVFSIFLLFLVGGFGFGLGGFGFRFGKDLDLLQR